MTQVTTIRIAATAGALAMAAMIVYGFAAGSFGAEGETILGLPWGRVTLVDLYVALLLGWLWIAWREHSSARAAVWLAAVVVLGSLALATYVAQAAWRADDVRALLVGARRATESWRRDAAGQR